MLSRRRLIGVSLAAVAAGFLPLPLLAARPHSAPRSFDLRAASGRVIAVSEWLPRGRLRGIVLFSHGALSAPHFYEAIIAPWVAAGWRVLAPLHVDSALHPETAKYPGLASWKTRIEDMRALAAHIGNRSWVAAGHSYGALVALTMGGAAAIPPRGLSGPLDNANVRAVIAFSPPAPIPVLISAAGYGTLKAPALIQTGTADIVPGMSGPEGWRGHLAPFEAAVPGNGRYGLVLEGVDHYFGGGICRYDLPGPKQLDRLADANRIAGLFLEGFGNRRTASRRALDAAVTESLPVRLLRK